MPTVSWSKGRNKKYPYYTCQTRICDLRGKSIRQDKLEGEFGEIVAALRPAPQLFHMAKEMFEDFWNARLADVSGRADSLATQLANLTRKMET
ncbi:MAG: zinc ribbon domain-containing protein, partial [Henriciella sp.]|nr:zinc ribbon domain-containing protein [Henriciella sp.]